MAQRMSEHQYIDASAKKLPNNLVRMHDANEASYTLVSIGKKQQRFMQREEAGAAR